MSIKSVIYYDGNSDEFQAFFEESKKLKTFIKNTIILTDTFVSKKSDIVNYSSADGSKRARRIIKQSNRIIGFIFDFQDKKTRRLIDNIEEVKKLISYIATGTHRDRERLDFFLSTVNKMETIVYTNIKNYSKEFDTIYKRLNGISVVKEIMEELEMRMEDTEQYFKNIIGIKQELEKIDNRTQVIENPESDEKNSFIWASVIAIGIALVVILFVV